MGTVESNDGIFISSHMILSYLIPTPPCMVGQIACPVPTLPLPHPQYSYKAQFCLICHTLLHTYYIFIFIKMVSLI